MHDNTGDNQHHRHTNWWPWLLLVVVLALWTRDALPRLVHGPEGNRPLIPRGDLADDEQSTIELFRESSRSVVYVNPLIEQRIYLSPARYTTEFQPAGHGSGVLWDEDGHIVTNFHVINGADGYSVTLGDGSVYDAELVGYAAHKDLAVLKINEPIDSPRPIPVGTSTDLLVGQKVFAIGNPYGLDFTLTTGIVSALNRQITSLTGVTIHNVIQTDAAINPGNSGGPLLDSSGRLIGINTAIYSPSGTNTGIGFAVPVAVVKDVVPQLIDHGSYTRPGLGVEIADGRPNGVEGCIVKVVRTGSSAENAGLRPPRIVGRKRVFDIITAIEEHPTRTFDELYHALDDFKVGDTVRVHVERGPIRARERQKYVAEVTLQAISSF